MRLTKYAHACVRLDKDEQSLIIDPGAFTERDLLAGTTAVLVTHEHFDHLDIELLKAAQEQFRELKIYSTHAIVEDLVSKGLTADAVSVGDSFQAAGFTIDAVGGLHAEIFDGLPGCANVGFIVDSTLYHPGDALFVPDVEVETLLVPVSGPWLKLAEAISFTRVIRPRRAYPIHDALLSASGLAVTDSWMGRKGETDYSRIEPGESVDL